MLMVLIQLVALVLLLLLLNYYIKAPIYKCLLLHLLYFYRCVDDDF